MLDEHDIAELFSRSVDTLDPTREEKSDATSFNALLRNVVAPITPVLGVSETCFRQSLAYVRDLFNSTGEAKGWGRQSTYEQEETALWTSVKGNGSIHDGDGTRGIR